MPFVNTYRIVFLTLNLAARTLNHDLEWTIFVLFYFLVGRRPRDRFSERKENKVDLSRFQEGKFENPEFSTSTMDRFQKRKPNLQEDLINSINARK
ncbi:hypothetical protein CDAR_586351 [Caerostris darwini]|uniref:Uncharacterized protein n=1 Tax=Caerostris darwini TaxID=1538125 RepID=A0AAV4QA50_9ARAC|nr:hypothetical protein CDAR_586351 [Caerostris darwini]